jgi:uncharacterized protein
VYSQFASVAVKTEAKSQLPNGGKELLLNLEIRINQVTVMGLDNKEVLLKANAAVSEGNNEGFLSFCTEDVIWEFVGDTVLKGKQAVRDYMAVSYATPPKFQVLNLIAEDDFVTAIGTISIKDEEGAMGNYSYCDVWRFSDGKMAALKAFVIRLDKDQ